MQRSKRLRRQLKQKKRKMKHTKKLMPRQKPKNVQMKWQRKSKMREISARRRLIKL
jgi:hypothetical protein